MTLTPSRITNSKVLEKGNKLLEKIEGLLNNKYCIHHNVQLEKIEKEVSRIVNKIRANGMNSTYNDRQSVDEAVTTVLDIETRVRLKELSSHKDILSKEIL